MPPTFRRSELVDWFQEHYPAVKPNTVTAHITAATVNSHSRHHYPGGDQHLIFKRSDGLLLRYDASRHGRWDRHGDLIPGNVADQPAGDVLNERVEPNQVRRTSPRTPRPAPPFTSSPDARAEIGRTLELLAVGLAPFVGQRMREVRGTNWYDTFRGRNDAPGLEQALKDPRFLLRVMVEAWDAFSPPLSRRERSYVFELKDTGNAWAHYDELTLDDVDRALDSIERLLTPIEAEVAARARQARIELRRRRDS